MFCSVNGVRVESLTLIRPPKGLWTADLFATDGLPSNTGAATLVLAGLTLQGAIYRAGEFLDDGFARLIGGRGGWHRTLPKNYYASPFGVKLAPVLRDAANTVGESVTVATDTTIGNYYLRKAAPAVRVLNQLCPSWYAREDGTTFVGPVETPTISSRFDVLAEGTSFASGRVMIATDRPEDWVPGCLFTAPTITTQRQVSTVVHRLTKNTLRTEIWLSP